MKVSEKSHFYFLICRWPQHGQKIEISVMGDADFCNFQNASPRECSGRIPRNSTHLQYSWILQTGRVTAYVLIFTSLATTCEHGRKIEICFIMGDVDFVQFSKCISGWMLRPFSDTLHSRTLLVDTTNWYSNSLCNHFYTTRHHLWTWAKNRNFRYGRCPIFAIFKMHLRVNAPAVFRETPLTYTIRGYYKLVE